MRFHAVLKIALLAALVTFCLLTGCSRHEPATSSAASGSSTAAASINPSPVLATAKAGAGSSSAGTPQAAASVTNKPLPATETAVLAGGCFWGVEELLSALPGVIRTEVGYTGGTVPTPTYSDVKTGRSGHAEAVRIGFDPKTLSYERLLLYFFKIHDPTTVNRQGNDVGTQYRSAIFYQSPEQERVAKATIAKVDASGDWADSVSTEVVAGSEFTLAEEYHQDYLKKNPGGYTCHFERDVSYY